MFIDLNRDMRISFDEAMEYLHKRNVVPLNQKQNLFSRVDKNMDGFISPEEFDEILNIYELLALKLYFWTLNFDFKETSVWREIV